MTAPLPPEASAQPENLADITAIARHLAAALGGRPAFRQHGAPETGRVEEILALTGTPDPRATTWATTGLAASAGGWRIELILAGASEDQGFDAALAALALTPGGAGELVPGRVIPGALPQGLSPGLPHLMVVAPFLWDEPPGPLTLPSGPQVLFLQVIPIAESERAFLVREGEEALEDRFEAAEVDVFDLTRPPAV